MPYTSLALLIEGIGVHDTLNFRSPSTQVRRAPVNDISCKRFIRVHSKNPPAMPSSHTHSHTLFLKVASPDMHPLIRLDITFHQGTLHLA